MAEGMNFGIHLELKIDPRDLAINLRYRGSHALPAKARKAHQRICEAVGEWIKSHDYQPCDRCEVYLEFTFPSRRSDIDGPIKRTIDGLERGLKDWDIDWNDNRVEKLHVIRKIGPDPLIKITMVPAFPGD